MVMDRMTLVEMSGLATPVGPGFRQDDGSGGGARSRRFSGESRNPLVYHGWASEPSPQENVAAQWVPAFAGTTGDLSKELSATDGLSLAGDSTGSPRTDFNGANNVFPAKAGIH